MITIKIIILFLLFNLWNKIYIKFSFMRFLSKHVIYLIKYIFWNNVKIVLLSMTYMSVCLFFDVYKKSLS